MSQDSIQQRNEETLSKALLATLDARDRLERSNRQDDVVLLNAAQFALLFNFDLSCLVSDVREHRASWRAKLYGRALAMLMYECADDLTHVLGKQFQDLIALRYHEHGVSALRSLLAELRPLRQLCEERYGPLRDQVVAHRDHNASTQIALLRRLDIEQAVSTATDFVAWLNRLYEYVTPLLAPVGAGA